jgi:hypothetical protein
MAQNKNRSNMQSTQYIKRTQKKKKNIHVRPVEDGEPRTSGGRNCPMMLEVER